MTTDKIQEEIYNHFINNIKAPTTLIVERKAYDEYVNDMMSHAYYAPISQFNVDRITINGYTLRVILATNLKEGEVIVI